MRYLLLAIAILLSQSACANDSTKVRKNRKTEITDTIKVAKAKKERVKKDFDTLKVDKKKRIKEEKKVDTVAVVTTPPAPLYYDIIPQPLSLVKSEGRFTINERTALICDKEFLKVKEYLLQYLPLTRTNGKKSNSIRLVFDKKLKHEEYSLTINDKGVEICGSDHAGIFNGIQSLFQLMPHAIYTKNCVPTMEIPYIEVKDAPQYHYRGLLLDVARTFQPVHEVKRVIDYMAYLKLNKLHLHLIDNEAWRIELKKYPQFAEVGGFRGGDSPLASIYGRFNKKYGGYYTQEELRDIVAYAAERNIEVIPEIDMPGHSKALGTIHPAIRCNYTPDTSSTNGLDIRNVWCVAKESNYALIEDIIKELVEIFPSEYIHIGGDEVNFSHWKPCPDCQRLMKEKGLKNGEQLEQYFLNRVSNILTKYNRKAVVWDEAVDGGLLPKTTMVTGWRGVKQCLSTTSQGYSTIIMPSSVFYLDKRQSVYEGGASSRSGISLKTICDFSFDNAGFTTEQHKYIAGIEGAFWSEMYLMNIDSKKHFSDYLEYMLFPRMLAVSEVAWSKERRSYGDMMKVLKENFYHKLHAMSATFRLETPEVKIENGKIFVSTDDGAKLYYKDIRTNKIEEYKAPLNADLAPFVIFQSRLMTGRSAWIGSTIYHNPRKPEVKITSSIPFGSRYPISNCELYKGVSRTTRAAKRGDWIEFRFKEPVRASYIKVTTGYAYMYRRLITNGHVEVCYDGENFDKAGNLHNGNIILRPKKRELIAIRIVADGVSDAENSIMIQPLEIR